VTPQTWIEGLGFPEAPRWFRGQLWFSDFAQRVVRRADADGSLTEVVRVAARPSGLGALSDGSLLVVSMDDRRLLREVNGQMQTHADLSGYTAHPCNDMVVSRSGNAYVGHMGFDLFVRPLQVRSAHLLLVRPDGSSTIAADDLLFPNGVVLTPDQKTLIVAETFGQRLTAFTVGDDGLLTDRRVFAALPGRSPDGICLDSQGAVWVADAAGKACVRVREGGEVLDTITTARGCFACALGGDDGQTLFLCTAEGFGPRETARNTGAIETVRVSVPATPSS
jgi:sugar lactone lactonase YvrE